MLNRDKKCYTNRMKLWIQTNTDSKIKSDCIVTLKDNFSFEDFHASVREACNELDVGAPIILANHVKHFRKFNIVRFKKDDFVETIYFDALVIELIKEKKEDPFLY